LNIKHLKEVATLEKQVYPEELCLGYEDYVNDFKEVSCYQNASLGAFVNGELKAYIICYRKDKSRYYYVSDLVCTNPKILLPLLIIFGNMNNNSILEAELRYSSYRMVEHIIEKYPGFINVMEKEKVSSYYFNGEDMYRLKFKVDMDPINHNPKFLILKEIYVPNHFQVNIKNILYQLYFNYNMSAEEIRKCKPFILRHLHMRNLDALRMLGDTFRFIVNYVCIFKTAKACNEMKQYLLGKGYTEGDVNAEDIKSYDNKFNTSPRGNHMIWSKVGELNTKFKDDTISYYRSHIKRKFINYYKKDRFVREVIIKDKYGDEWLTVTPQDNVYSLIPRNFSNIFDAQLRKLEFLKNIRNTVESLFPNDNAFMLVNSNGIPAIRKVAGEEVAYGYFNKVIDMAKNAKNKEEILHDWGYIVPEVLQFEKYLTKGAIKHIFLNKSLNQINKIKDTLTGLQIDGANYLDTKALRKAISRAVKNDEDLAPIVSKAVKEAEIQWLKRKRISQNLFENMLVFVERMKKYSPQISINMLFRHFGRETINMVKGKYEGYFQEKLIPMNYKELGLFILETLDKRTKRNKRLFGALSKIQDIGEIFEGNILPENFDKIIAELKQRNITVPDEFYNLNRFYAKIEQKCSPEYLIAGNASVCCMSFGQSNAITYALEKGFGIINIYYKDRVIANSVIWINEPYNCLVLDNIEVHPNYKKFNNIIKRLFDRTVNYLIKEYHLDFAVQGANYNDLHMYNPGAEKIRFEVLKPVEVKSDYFYTDARYVYPLDFNMSSENVKNRINEVNISIRKEQNKEGIRADMDFLGEELAF
jgi:hypothetical protein